MSASPANEATDFTDATDGEPIAITPVFSRNGRRLNRREAEAFVSVQSV